MESTIHKKPAVYNLRSLTLRDMVGPLFRNRLVVVLVFSVFFAGAVLLAWSWAKHYYVATMQIVVARERSNPTLTGQQSGAADNATSVTADEVASEVALLQGRDMLEEVVRGCGLTKQPSMTRSLLHVPRSERTEADDPRALEIETMALAGKLRVEAQRMS